MEKLRQEIIEAQKMRSDLIKWKLLLVAGLGAAGLGLKGKPQENMTNMPLLLCLIPFVCLYVDLAARHLNLRMHVIAEFLRRHAGSHQGKEWLALYEESCKVMDRGGVFALETWVLKYSTIILSILVILAGAVMYLPEALQSHPTNKNLWILITLFSLSGLIGIVAAFLIEEFYKKKVFLIASCESD